MKPSKFAQSTASLRRPSTMSEKECGSLDVWQGCLAYPPEGYTLSRWRPSLRERLALLFGGSVWLWIHAGGSTQPPAALSASLRGPFERSRGAS